MERQALRRIDAGGLSDDQVERMGTTFLELDKRMTQLREQFGLDEDDLNLDLGPFRAPSLRGIRTDLSVPRERLVESAYRLFSTRGVRAVGVDEVIADAGVAKATLYHHFPSKDDLVVAFLAEREQRWTFDWVAAEARRRGATPEERLLAIFDLFDEWFRRDDFEGCSSINVLLELSARPSGPACQHRAPGDHPHGRRRAGGRGRDARPGRVRALVAHPHEGLDRAGGRGRRRRRRRAQELARMLIHHHSEVPRT